MTQRSSSRGKSRAKTVLVLSDLHSVFMDQKAVDAVKRVADALEPDQVVSIGDFMDFYTLSRFDKDPERRESASVKKEVESVQPIIRWMEEISDLPPEITWGNHDIRYERYLKKQAPEVFGYRRPSLRELLNLPERWVTHPYGKVRWMGQIGLTHGDTVRSKSGYSAHGQREKAGGNILHGHTHRQSAVFRTDASGTYAAYEIGHLCDPWPEYCTSKPDWQQGFAILHLTHNGKFQVELVRIEEQARKSRALWRGEWW